jgi:hypothetical protein
VIETVASFQDPVEAQIVRALLESAGIAAIVADLNLVTLDWPMAQALGGVKLQVPHKDVPEALGLIAAYRSGELASEDDEADDRCGVCGSTELDSFVPASQKALALAVFAFAAAPISTRTRRVCTICGAVETQD